MRHRFGPPIRSTAESRITRSAIIHHAAPSLAARRDVGFGQVSALPLVHASIARGSSAWLSSYQSAHACWLVYCRALGRGQIGIRFGLGERLTSRVADPTLFGLIGINPPPSAAGPPSARVADPTLFGLSGIDPPPSAVGLAGGRVADPTLFGLAGINPPPSAVRRRALSINGCCRKENAPVE
jgi:hypothetical protein